MTTHRIDEPIALVKLSPNTVRHIRRPRSQKGVAYCGAFLAMASAEGLELVIQDPTEIPLEVRQERDFADLCRKCARQFLEDVTKEYPDMRLCPVAWRLIVDRCGLTPAQIETVQRGIDEPADWMTGETMDHEAEQQALEARAEHEGDRRRERSQEVDE